MAAELSPIGTFAIPEPLFPAIRSVVFEQSGPPRYRSGGFARRPTSPDVMLDFFGKAGDFPA